MPCLSLLNFRPKCCTADAVSSAQALQLQPSPRQPIYACAQPRRCAISSCISKFLLARARFGLRHGAHDADSSEHALSHIFSHSRTPRSCSSHQFCRATSLMLLPPCHDDASPA